MSRYCDPASLPQLPSRIGSTHLVDDSENSRQRPFPEATRCKSPKRPHGSFTSRPINGADPIPAQKLRTPDIIALATKMAWTVLALLAYNEVYQDPALAANRTG